MGAWLPDRFFWARSNDDETPPSPASPGTDPERQHPAGGAARRH